MKRFIFLVAVGILLTGCGEHEKSNNSNSSDIIVETIEVETIEVESIIH